MSLLPDEIASKTFPRRTRGYDPSQVSAFLQRAAVDYAAAIHRISEVAEDRSWSRRAREELSGGAGRCLLPGPPGRRAGTAGSR